MNQGFYGFPRLLDIVRATSVKVLGKAGATAGCALAGATTSGAPTSGGPFDVGDMVVGQNGTLWICTTAGTSQSSPGSFTQVGPTTSPLSTKGDVWVYGSADARLAVGSNDQVLVADSTQTLGMRWGASPAGAGGALTQIAQTVLGSSAASITFSGIAGSYSNLSLTIDGRGDASAVFAEVNCQVNSDTASNYDWERVDASGTNSIASSGTAGDTSLHLSYITANTGPANTASGGAFTFFNYAGTTFFKHVSSTGGLKDGTTTAGFFVNRVEGWWKSTAAITAIKVFPSSGNFVAGTVATLYGWS